MNQKLILPAGILLALVLSSCKKEYTCRCVTTTGAYSVPTERTVTMKKKDAVETCEAQSSSEVIQGVSNSTKCEIL